MTRGDHISLFSGVGMTDIAAEAHGFRTVATAEIDEFNRKVLGRRFPAARHYNDVRQIKADGSCIALRSLKRPLLVSGGFPCQDVSGAGHGKGLDGERSGLWSEFKRVIGEFKPEYVLIENVSMLRSRGLDRVLSDLHKLGYDAQWDCIPAAAVGAPHLRDRIWIGAVKRGASRNREALEVKIIGHVEKNRVYFEGAPFAKFPRAGAQIGGLVFRREPQATIKAAKAALAEHQHGCEATPTRAWPTPDASVAQDGEQPATWLARREVLKAKGTNGNGAGMPLAMAVKLLPTPTKQDGSNNGGPAQFERNSLPLNAYVKVYPTPTTRDGIAGPGTSPKRAGGKNLRTVINEQDGDYKLAPTWVEWLMGLPEGWTNPDVPNDDLSPHAGWVGMDEPAPRVEPGAPYRRQRLHALGNGLVPQVAAVAINDLLNW